MNCTSPSPGCTQLVWCRLGVSNGFPAPYGRQTGLGDRSCGNSHGLSWCCCWEVPDAAEIRETECPGRREQSKSRQEMIWESKGFLYKDAGDWGLYSPLHGGCWVLRWGGMSVVVRSGTSVSQRCQGHPCSRGDNQLRPWCSCLVPSTFSHRKLILSQLPRLEDICSRQHQAAGMHEVSLGSQFCVWRDVGSMEVLCALSTADINWGTAQTPGPVLSSPAWGAESLGSHPQEAELGYKGFVFLHELFLKPGNQTVMWWCCRTVQLRVPTSSTGHRNGNLLHHPRGHAGTHRLWRCWWLLSGWWAAFVRCSWWIKQQCFIKSTPN